MKAFIIAGAVIFAWLYADLFKTARAVPLVALAAVPVAIIGLCVDLATDPAAILETIGIGYGIFVIVIAVGWGIGGLVRRRLRTDA